ncbi:MAG: hypothetical protein V1862_14290 [Methanobacteriota archaeon]
MRIRLLFILFIAFFITFSGVSSSAVTDEHTVDEWRAILAVPPGSGMLTGLQIALTINPDQYYFPIGSTVNLTGDVYNIFGPVDNASVILAKGEGEQPVPFENLTTDQNGKFSTVDMVNSSMPIRYQIWFEGSDNKKKNLILSNEIEIFGEQREGFEDGVISNVSDVVIKPGLSATALASKKGEETGEKVGGDRSDIFSVVIAGDVTGYQGPESDAMVTISRIQSTGEEPLGYRITGSDGLFELTDMTTISELPVSYQIVSDMGTPDPSDDQVTTVIVNAPALGDDGQNLTDVNVMDDLDNGLNQSEFPRISLKADSDSFISGQNITFSGLVTSAKGTPLPYAGVAIEQLIRGSFSKIGDSLSTDRNGTYSISYHLTGPSSPIFRAVSSDEKGEDLVSGQISLSFLPDNFFPLSRDRMKSRHIDAALSPSVISPGENITISGWFADGNGDGISTGRLTLYWFNFVDRIWDPYGSRTESITNEDGYYSFIVNGPNATGISYFAVVSKREQGGDPLFSSVLALTVRGDEINTSSILPTTMTAHSNPSEVIVNDQAVVTFTLTDLTGIPLAGEPLHLYFSEDGFTWYMNGNENVTTNTEGIVTLTDSPQQAGFHYYQGVYDGSTQYGPTDSGILIIPALDFSASHPLAGENTTPVVSKTDLTNGTDTEVIPVREFGNTSSG